MTIQSSSNYPAGFLSVEMGDPRHFVSTYTPPRLTTNNSIKLFSIMKFA